MPWEEFRPLLDQVWRKPMDAVLIFKTLVLSGLYNLSEDIEAKRKARGLTSRIYCKEKRGKSLGERAVVEHVFGAQANDMGGTRVRTIGLVRAKAKIGMKNLACNIRRLGQLHRLNPFPA